MNSRIYIGVPLAIFAIACFYFQCIILLFLASSIASANDVCHMMSENVNLVIIIALSTISMLFHRIMLTLYTIDPGAVIGLILITQASDVYQYIIGINFGVNKIGWISKQKTYEGYIGGFCLTLLTFGWYYGYRSTAIIYLAGILGGLLSSLLKRTIGLKNYSNLLGEHGGWLDRIDSVILPCFIYEQISFAHLR